MQDGSSVFQISYLTLTENLRSRKRAALLSLIVIFCAAIVFAPYILSLAKQTTACNWNNGWKAWKNGETETALSCWSKNSFMTVIAPRPARIYYWRARALEKLGRYDEAKLIKRYLAKKFPFDFYTFLLFPNGGASIYPSEDSIKAETLFYPRPWRGEVAMASRRTGVPQYMIWAVMKRESKFKIQAVSESGAKGLMQLMPSTAEAEALSLKMRNLNIYFPGHNILLGANHFARQMKRFDGEIIRSVAAYNAGTTSVVRWNTLSANDWAEWIEEIPYAETREFVRSVLENREVYRIVCRYDDKSIFTVAGEAPMPIGDLASAARSRAEYSK